MGVLDMAQLMVRLRAYGGEVIERQVVDEDESAIYVTRPEEVTKSAALGRAPRVVGFPLADIVSRDES